MLKIIAAAATATLIGAGTFVATGSSASAASLPIHQSGDAYVDDSAMVQEAGGGHKNYKGHRKYNYKYHGKRCHKKGKGCGHYYNGWWYGTRWWIGPTVVIGGGGGNYGYGSGHVDWCLAHYRSYNPSSNTWIAYGGDVRVCVSPYY